MTELFRVRLHEAIAEVERELKMRGRFYSERVRTGRMSRLTADMQYDRLEAARLFLVELSETKGGDYEGQATSKDGALAR